MLGEHKAVTAASSLPSLAGALEQEAVSVVWAGLPLPQSRAERHLHGTQVLSDLLSPEGWGQVARECLCHSLKACRSVQRQLK